MKCFIDQPENTASEIKVTRDREIEAVAVLELLGSFLAICYCSSLSFCHFLQYSIYHNNRTWWHGPIKHDFDLKICKIERKGQKSIGCPLKTFNTEVKFKKFLLWDFE